MIVQHCSRISGHCPAVVRIGACCLILLAFGCGGESGKPETASVSGTVLLDGEPVPVGEVVFDAETAGFSVGAQLSPTGRYEFEFELPQGKYRVYLVSMSQPGIYAAEELEMMPQLPENVPEKYRGVTTTDLSATVSKGRNTIDFELKTEAP